MFLVHCKVGVLQIMLLNFFSRGNERIIRSFRKTEGSCMSIEIVDRKSFYKGTLGCRDKHYCDGLSSSAYLFLPSLFIFIIFKTEFPYLV